jgi:hypothetical protein
MKHLKLFEEMNIIEEIEFPYDGHDLSPRESKILSDLIGEKNFKLFYIKVDDHYYYVNYHNNIHYVVFDDFNELKDYLLSNHYIREKEIEKYLELLRNSKLDPSFHDNWPITWASILGYTEIVKHLLSDPRVDPSTDNNQSIKWASAYGQMEVVKLLLNDPRVRYKLTEEEINEYTHETS